MSICGNIPDVNTWNEETFRWAKYFNDLLSNPSWITRRVETLSMLDLAHWEHKVSLDIDIPSVFEAARLAGIIDCDILPIPIDSLVKNLMVDFDLSDNQGRPKSLLVREGDSRVAALATLGLMNEKGLSGLINDDVIESLKGITIDFTDNWDSLKDGDTWKEIVDISGDVSHRISMYSKNFPLVTWIDASETCAIIKYRYVDTAELKPWKKLKEIKPWKKLKEIRPWKKLKENYWKESKRITRHGFPLKVKNPHVGEAGREHFRFIAPEGFEISEPPIATCKSEFIRGGNDSLNAFYRATPGHIIIYTKAEAGSGWADTMDVYFAIRPKRTGFIKTAFYCLLTSLLLTALLILWAIAKISLNYFFLVDKLNTGDIGMIVVPVLLIIPTLFLTYIMTMDRGNHIRHELLHVPRHLIAYTIAASAFSTLICLTHITIALIVSWILVLILTSVSLKNIRRWINCTKESQDNILENMNSTVKLHKILYNCTNDGVNRNP